MVMPGMHSIPGIIFLFGKEIVAEHLPAHGMNVGEFCPPQRQRTVVSFSGDFQIKQTLVVYIPQTGHHILPVHVAVTEGHKMLIPGGVIVGNMQRNQLVAGFADKFTLGVGYKALAPGKIQVTGVQADAQMIASNGMDQGQKFLCGSVFQTKIFQSDGHVGSL